MKIICAIYNDRLRYEEVQDYDELLEMFTEQGVDFDEQTREVDISHRYLDEYNGNHLMFGWFETLIQSDECPYWIMDDKDYRLECIREDDDN